MSTRLSCLFVLLCSMTACGGGGGTACATDDQCPSHFCKADGTCGEAMVDASMSDGSDAAGSDAMTALCTPNHDGMIDANEVPLKAGQMAKFRIATDATWSTAGHANADGSRTWDLSGQLANDADDQLALLSPAGTWWAADFPNAQYATTLAAGSDLMGVFAVDASGVTLLGVVSPTGSSAENPKRSSIMRTSRPSCSRIRRSERSVCRKRPRVRRTETTSPSTACVSARCSARYRRTPSARS